VREPTVPSQAGYSGKGEVFMSDDDGWHYSHKNSQGYDVNANGYDRSGKFRGWFREDNSNQSQSGGSYRGGAAKAGGGGGLLFLIFLLVVWERIINFLEANWISLLTILGICAACAIACIIVKHKVKKSGLKRFFIVLASIGLIFGVLNLGMMRNDGNFHMLRSGHFFNSVASKNNKTKTVYAYINIDQLNLRAGPSVSYDIIKGLSKDTRIEVIDNSETWWKIKHENTEGYVNSEFLRKE